MNVQHEVQDSPHEGIRSVGFSQTPNSKFTQSREWEIFKGAASEPENCWILHNLIGKTRGSCTPLVHPCLCSCSLRCSSDLNLRTQCSMRNDFSLLFNHEQTIQTHKFIAANIVHYLSQGHFIDFSFNIFPFSVHFRGSYCREVTLITSFISRLLKLY